jgi:hypothetical protein
MLKTLSASIAIISLFTASLAFPATHTLPDQKAAKDLVSTVMSKVAIGDTDAAFNIMNPYSPLSETEKASAVLQTKSMLQQFGARYGTPIGYEFIDSKQVGESLLRFRCIEKTEKHAILWSFYFYKPSKGWILDTFAWKDVFAELFYN